jgi:hypothetical protein
MIIVRLDVGQEVETNMSHHALNSASRTFRMLSMEDKKQVAMPLTEPWIAYERGNGKSGSVLPPCMHVIYEGCQTCICRQ